jgi:phosphomannomutase
MISVAGIRGIVGDSLKVEEFFQYVLAFATLAGGGKIVVGGDSRVSGDMLRHLAFAALQSAGCEIIDLGLVPTPTVGIMIRHLQASGGIAITASHNPAEWNAYKFFGSHGSFLDNAAKDRLLQIAESGEFLRADYKSLGQVIPTDEAVSVHISRVLSAVPAAPVAEKKFKVLVDCVNGVGRRIAEPLLQALGCETRIIHGEPTGIFPHNPEPLPENLTDLRAAMKEWHADIGFAIDPDADRLAVVDETGAAIGEERTLVLAARTALKMHRAKGGSDTSQTAPAMVVNLSSTRALDDVAREFGCNITRTPIGEAWVVKEIMDREALIGGEGNGGVIYPAVHPGRDAATGIALILHGLAAAGKPVSEWNREVPDYVMIKTKFPATSDAVGRLQSLVGTEFADAAELVTIDGVKAVYADRWVHVRPSGTEPVVRIFAEAPDEAAAQTLISRAQDLF